MAVHRRKQAVTKTNEGGRGGGRARGELRRDGRLDPSASTIPRPADLPPSRRVSTSSHHLSDCWGGADGSGPALFSFFWWICLCRSLPARPPSGGVLKQTCPLTRLPSSTSWLEENEKNAVKLKKRKKKPRTQFSEAWKVISDRTCQGFMRDLLRVMKKKGENGEISFTKTKQRLQKNAIRSFPALPYKSIYTKVAEQRGFAGHN